MHGRKNIKNIGQNILGEIISRYTRCVIKTHTQTQAHTHTLTHTHVHTYTHTHTHTHTLTHIYSYSHTHRHTHSQLHKNLVGWLVGWLVWWLVYRLFGCSRISRKSVWIGRASVTNPPASTACWSLQNSPVHVRTYGKPHFPNSEEHTVHWVSPSL